MLEAQDKVAVITGGSRGIGAGLARVFARAGMSVALCGRTAPSQVTVASGQRKTIYRRVDVTEVEAVESFAEEVEATLGPIDLWVNNAGLIQPIGMTREVDPFLFRKLLDVNVLGVYHGARAFLRRLRRDGRAGALVNIGSGASTSAYAGWGPYCASKAAVDHLTRVLALEEADLGTRVWSLAPGVIESQMQEVIRKQKAEDFPAVERFRQMQSEGALLDPEAPGDLVLKLAFGPDPGLPDVVVDARDLRERGF